MENRIKKVMSAVFELPEEVINNESSPDNIESWDSLKHMNLVVSLEEEFEIEFKNDEIIKLLNFEIIKTMVNEKL